LEYNEILKFDRHYIAGLSTAFIVVAPMARAFLDADVLLYFILTAVLLVMAGLSTSAWRLHPFQTGWAVLLFTLFIALFATSFRFTDNIRQFIVAASFLGSTLLVGLVSILGWNKWFFSGFLRFTVFVSSLIAVLIFYGYLATNKDFRTIWNVGYLSAGTIISIGFCLALPFFIYEKGPSKLFWGVVSLVHLMGIITGLSRGALLFSTMVTFFLFMFYWPSNNGKRSKSLMVRLFVILSGAVGMFAFLPDRTVQRFERLFYGQELLDGGRGILWKNAIEFIAEAPLFGHGLGHGGGAVMYPHNLFLQVGMDGGIIAMGLLAIITSYPLIVFVISFYNGKIKDQPLSWGFLAVYLFLVLEYSKSYDLYKARSLFVFGGVLIGYVGLESKNSHRTFCSEPEIPIN